MGNLHLNKTIVTPKKQPQLNFNVNSKFAVVTLATGEKGRGLLSVSHDCFASYAKKYEADFHIISGEPSEFPFEDKFLVSQYFKFYDRVIYLDADVLIVEDAPNLFELVPANKVGICNENLYTKSMTGWWSAEYELMQEIQIDYNFLSQRSVSYYNAGFWIASKEHANLFEAPTKPYKVFHEAEQHLLNARILEYKVQIHEFDPELVWCYFSNREITSQKFLHFSGAANQIPLMLDFLKK